MLVNRNNFVEKEIPKLNPLSLEYERYWMDFKRKCVEGTWVGGVWCPGNLFFHLNAWHIKLNKKVTDKNKIVSRPFFREIEWEKSYIYVEARGFSGFSEDDEFSCYRLLKDFNPEEGIVLPKSCYKKDGSLKKYIPARDYLQKTHFKNLGKALFENEASNVMDLEARESGKSYFASSCIAHNFLLSGATDYDVYLEAKKSSEPMVSETLVGAIETKFSADLLSKVQVGLDYLPGGIVFNNRKYPSPLSLAYNGSWHPGNNPIRAGYEKKVKGGWDKEGQGTLIHHRSFENELGGNGTRPNLAFIEEVGFQRNLIELLGALRDCTTNSGVKFGTIWMLGTGGENDPVAIQPIESVFRDPDSYDCLVFEDIYEKRGKIGYFCPPFKADNEFLDHETGKIDQEKALNKVLKRREKLTKAKDKGPLNKEMQNKPIKPSEMFLASVGNVFPIAELTTQLNYLESSTDPDILGTCGMMAVNPGNGAVEFEPDLKNILRPCDYPVKKGDQAEGCVVIWEHPVENLGFGAYVAGCLLPGEKVITDKGLKNVEQVTFEDKLVNKDGEYVGINTLLRYDKVDEEVFKIKVSNTFRTTTFTQEHPILVSKPKYRTDKGVDWKKFDFNFTTANKVEVGDWIKVPNIYKSKNDFDIRVLWDNTDHRIDRQIDNPLDNKDFWWFVGLWLGDGWCESCGNKIAVVFNKKEVQYIDKFKRVVKDLFNRDVYIRDRNKGCVEVSFCLQQLNTFLNIHFGKYAGGKLIPEWAKRIDSDLKLNLLLGYFNSDGCLTKHTKGYFSLEFVSINLEMLESFQDICLSLGVVGNLSKLRDASEHDICGKKVKTKICYHLRFGHNDTVNLLQQIDVPEDIKITKVNLDNLPNVEKKAIKGCFIVGDYIYFKITEVEKSLYTGIVYNFDCETHTFMCHHITTHNCDPYSQDQAEHTTSLGSTFIMRRAIPGLFSHPQIVAEYTGRPSTVDEYNEQVMRLLIYYNAILLYENQIPNIKSFLERNNKLHHLAYTPTLLKSNIASKVSRVYGQHMTDQVKDELELDARDWLRRKVDETRANLNFIYSKPLLKELIAYNRDINTDRALAFLLCVCQDKELYQVIAKKREERQSTGFFTRKLFK